MVARQLHTRSGYTLTELLIVIMIALLLMVVSLPALKSVMEDARPREASRILNTMFFTAKSRAASSGLPAGIELVTQRMNDPMDAQAAYQCTQMYMIEVPSLYAGDTADARVSVDTSMSPWEFRFAGASAGSLPSLLDATNKFAIRINHRGPWYPVSYASNQYKLDTSANPPLNILPPTTDTNGYSFQIRRPPVRVGNPVELPKSTLIDMTYSGFGPTSDLAYNTSNMPPTPPVGMEFAVAAGLQIMFAPEGNLLGVSMARANPGGAASITSGAPLGTLHFLVGVAGKVTPLQEGGFSGTYNCFDPTKSNLADANALWVSVGRVSGIVTTNENAPDVAAVTDSSNAMQRRAYFEGCRQYATNREQKGGR